MRLAAGPHLFLSATLHHADWPADRPETEKGKIEREGERGEGRQRGVQLASGARRQCSRQSFRLSALRCIHRVHCCCCCVRVQSNLYVCGAIHICSSNSARFLIPSQISLSWLILFSFIISSNNVYNTSKQTNSSNFLINRDTSKIT